MCFTALMLYFDRPAAFCLLEITSQQKIFSISFLDNHHTARYFLRYCAPAQLSKSESTKMRDRCADALLLTAEIAIA
uniref:Secreted protein n=1 Tax=Parascaris univalens TaxID=6257 RepID=A0A915C4M3_PARUN